MVNFAVTPLQDGRLLIHNRNPDDKSWTNFTFPEKTSTQRDFPLQIISRISERVTTSFGDIVKKAMLKKSSFLSKEVRRTTRTINSSPDFKQFAISYSNTAVAALAFRIKVISEVFHYQNPDILDDHEELITGLYKAEVADWVRMSSECELIPSEYKKVSTAALEVQTCLSRTSLFGAKLYNNLAEQWVDAPESDSITEKKRLIGKYFRDEIENTNHLVDVIKESIRELDDVEDVRLIECLGEIEENIEAVDSDPEFCEIILKKLSELLLPRRKVAKRNLRDLSVRMMKLSEEDVARRLQGLMITQFLEEFHPSGENLRRLVGSPTSPKNPEKMSDLINRVWLRNTIRSCSHAIKAEYGLIYNEENGETLARELTGYRPEFKERSDRIEEAMGRAYKLTLWEKPPIKRQRDHRGKTALTDNSDLVERRVSLSLSGGLDRDAPGDDNEYVLDDAKTVLDVTMNMNNGDTFDIDLGDVEGLDRTEISSMLEKKSLSIQSLSLEDASSSWDSTDIKNVLETCPSLRRIRLRNMQISIGIIDALSTLTKVQSVDCSLSDFSMMGETIDWSKLNLSAIQRYNFENSNITQNQIDSLLNSLIHSDTQVPERIYIDLTGVPDLKPTDRQELLANSKLNIIIL